MIFPVHDHLLQMCSVIRVFFVSLCLIVTVLHVQSIERSYECCRPHWSRICPILRISPLFGSSDVMIFHRTIICCKCVPFSGFLQMDHVCFVVFEWIQNTYIYVYVISVCKMNIDWHWRSIDQTNNSTYIDVQHYHHNFFLRRIVQDFGRRRVYSKL